jgi:nicotinate-nucleotide pyrophosphorylase (carboxylating)
LDDAVLIKDNHLLFMQSVKEAVSKAKTGYDGKIEVEVENQKDALKAAEAGADIIMLDNMSREDAKASYQRLKELKPDVVVEISGGITPENIEVYAEYTDMISLGYLTHSVKSKDFSLEIVVQK